MTVICQTLHLHKPDFHRGTKRTNLGCFRCSMCAMAMDVVDYEIFGSEMQYVEVELDPGEAAIGEAGVMMYMQEGITMDTIFGDGSQQGGFFGKLMGAGKRLLTGEGLFTTVFQNSGAGKHSIVLDLRATERGAV